MLPWWTGRGRSLITGGFFCERFFLIAVCSLYAATGTSTTTLLQLNAHCLRYKGKTRQLEWPKPTPKFQLSFTVSLVAAGGEG